jgi:hypothetical protein
MTPMVIVPVVSAWIVLQLPLGILVGRWLARSAAAA